MNRLIILAQIRKNKKPWLERLIHIGINDCIRNPYCSSQTFVIYTIYRNPVSVNLLHFLTEYVMNNNDNGNTTIDGKNYLLKKLEKMIIVQTEYESKYESSPINSIRISDIIDYFLF